MVTDDAERAESSGGSFVVSLDVELYWGVHGVRAIESYSANLRGVPAAVDAMLRLFTEYGVNATWATVGFLFFDDPSELAFHQPAVLPHYANEPLSPYEYIASHSSTMARDLHVAPEVIARILKTPGQEVATHTFSHFNCLEPPVEPDAFRHDLQAALLVANQRVGRIPTSLVFPKNQYGRQHLEIARDLGITAFRGNGGHRIHNGHGAGDRRLHLRVARLVDSYLPVASARPSRPSVPIRGLVNVPADRFLRPWSPTLAWAERAKYRRIATEMRAAAVAGATYHLWWHPHNFGVNLAQNLAGLRVILDAFDHLRRTRGMQSRSMSSVANEVLLRSAAAPQ